LFGFPITTTFTSFQGLGKKQSKKQAFKILRSKGFIKGRLSKRRPAEMPSSPGADLQFKDLAAASNSQSDIDWGISLLLWLRERLEVSMMLTCKGSVGFSPGKKWSAHPSAMTAGSDVGRPSTTSSRGIGMDWAFPENSASALKVSPDDAR
jgi:hypothetical protein